MTDECMLIVFESTHKAIRTERLLLDRIDIDMIPTPREIGASCGLTISFEIADLEAVKGLLSREDKTGIDLYHYNKSSEIKASQRSWED
ncbi:DUF3343 domain-containing protein [Fusibacter ferrireducens]|nr:DUF3343 domain-containing protein [Fusibacter ferrireducens]